MAFGVQDLQTARLLHDSAGGKAALIVQVCRKRDKQDSPPPATPGSATTTTPTTPTTPNTPLSRVISQLNPSYQQLLVSWRGFSPPRDPPLFNLSTHLKDE